MSKNEELFLDKLEKFKINIGAFVLPYKERQEEEPTEPKEAC